MSAGAPGGQQQQQSSQTNGLLSGLLGGGGMLELLVRVLIGPFPKMVEKSGKLNSFISINNNSGKWDTHYFFMTVL